ncbi:MAG: hypothetical protein ACRENP_26030, partial [Longimicrobiales bacterium]
GQTRPGSGTGLRNTRERLASLYGPAAQLRIANAAAGGTVVTLDIPLAGTQHVLPDVVHA